MVAEVIYEFGQEEIKRKHVPKLCNGQYPAGSFAITEPHTGSDAGNIRTTAVRQKESYVLNGRKTLITSGEAQGSRSHGPSLKGMLRRGKGSVLSSSRREHLGSLLERQKKRSATGLHRPMNWSSIIVLSRPIVSWGKKERVSKSL